MTTQVQQVQETLEKMDIEYSDMPPTLKKKEKRRLSNKEILTQTIQGLLVENKELKKKISIRRKCEHDLLTENQQLQNFINLLRNKKTTTPNKNLDISSSCEGPDCPVIFDWDSKDERVWYMEKESDTGTAHLTVCRNCSLKYKKEGWDAYIQNFSQL